MKIGNLYFSYRLERKKKDVSGQEKDGWLLSESYSKTGKEGSWSTPREIAFYPGVNFEGIGFRYNEKTGKEDILPPRYSLHRLPRKAESK